MNIRLRTPVVCVFVALLSLLTAAIAYVIAAPFSAGDHSLTIKHNRHERSAIVHVPARAATSNPSLSSRCDGLARATACRGFCA